MINLTDQHRPIVQILEAKGDIKAAIPVLQKGAILDPESRAIQQVQLICTLSYVLLASSKLIRIVLFPFGWQQLLSKCIMKSRREARNEKDMYQKMLGQTQKMEGTEKHSKHSDAQDAPKV